MFYTDCKKQLHGNGGVCCIGRLQTCWRYSHQVSGSLNLSLLVGRPHAPLSLLTISGIRLFAAVFFSCRWEESPIKSMGSMQFSGMIHKNPAERFAPDNTSCSSNRKRAPPGCSPQVAIPKRYGVPEIRIFFKNCRTMTGIFIK